VTKHTVNNLEKHNMPLKYIATIAAYSFRTKYHAIICTNIRYIDCNLNQKYQHLYSMHTTFSVTCNMHILVTGLHIGSPQAMLNYRAIQYHQKPSTCC